MHKADAALNTFCYGADRWELPTTVCLPLCPATGFTGVLRQLLSRVAAPPATTSNQQDLHPRLRTRLIAATLRTYFSLSRAAVAVGSVEAAAQLLEEGLVLGMQRPDCHDLHALQPLLYELRAQLVYAENMKPYNPAAALLYWQLVARRKVRFVGVIACSSGLLCCGVTCKPGEFMYPVLIQCSIGPTPCTWPCQAATTACMMHFKSQPAVCVYTVSCVACILQGQERRRHQNHTVCPCTC
jgi:hypothetical protein